MMHKQIVITGQVHGVFFRQSALSKAGELNLKGWVRNDPAGTVTASVEGEESAIHVFIDWCKKGPPMAMVTGVIVQDLPAEHFYHFEIVKGNE